MKDKTFDEIAELAMKMVFPDVDEEFAEHIKAALKTNKAGILKTSAKMSDQILSGVGSDALVKVLANRAVNQIKAMEKSKAEKTEEE